MTQENPAKKKNRIEIGFCIPVGKVEIRLYDQQSQMYVSHSELRQCIDGGGLLQLGPNLSQGGAEKTTLCVSLGNSHVFRQSWTPLRVVGVIEGRIEHTLQKPLKT